MQFACAEAKSIVSSINKIAPKIKRFEYHHMMAPILDKFGKHHSSSKWT